jgi:hypothetical protein
MRARGCSPARANQSPVRRDRRVVASFRISGRAASQAGVTSRGTVPVGRHEGTHRVAAPGPDVQAGHRRPAATPPGPRPACRRPGATRSRPTSAPPPARRCRRAAGANACKAWGSRWAMAPVLAPRRTRPLSPCTWRRTSSSASSASASRRRARSISDWPTPVGTTRARPRTSSRAPRRDSSSATCKRDGRRRQVQHARSSGKAAQVGHRQQGAQAVEVDLAHHAAPFRFSEGRLCQIQLAGIGGCRDDVRHPAPESPTP